MVEPFGVVSGAVGISAAFSACIDVFKYVRLSRRFGKDYYTSQLKLTLLQLRLSRWGEAVRVYEDPQLGNPSASDAEVQAAKNVFLQIRELFEDRNKTSQMFGASASDDGVGLPTTGSDGEIAALLVNRKMRDIAETRQRSASLPKLVSWSIHHSAAFRTLINDIAELLGDLERLFPLPPTTQNRLLALEATQTQTVEEMRVLATSSEGIDDALHQAVKRKTGHEYRKINIDSGTDGATINGNLYSDDYKGSDGGGASHSYEGIDIKGTTGLRVLDGNRYGGPDFFSRN
ncbi:hypothetical protein QQZ08_005907 [Neonectria magnoliae]|uniref:Prion-inhibition and propagation HeLo domain-containing protein n=1 Tax=Neonectria magnoliae TaxID=2732573 RepID=A0ABR1I2A4_9HYPO